MAIYIENVKKAKQWKYSAKPNRLGVAYVRKSFYVSMKMSLMSHVEKKW